MEVPKKEKRLLDAQYKIYCKLVLLVLDSPEQELSETNYLSVFIKCARECFKLKKDYPECRRITKKMMSQIIKEYGVLFDMSDEHMDHVLDELVKLKVIPSKSGWF